MTAIYLITDCGALSGPVSFPVVPGVGPQLPSDAIELPGKLLPPDEGKVWALVDGAPGQLVDYRGKIYSTATGEPQEHIALGELPDGFTSEPRPSLGHSWTDGAWQLDPVLVAKLHKDAQNLAWERIKAERDQRVLAGFHVGTEWVHSDLFSRSQWLGLKDNARDALAAGGTMATALRDSEDKPIVWKMLDGSFAPVTAQLAFDVVAAVTRSDMAIYTVAEAHNRAMRAVEDPAAYDFTMGWPQTYAEWAQSEAESAEIIPPAEPVPDTEPEPTEEKAQ